MVKYKSNKYKNIFFHNLDIHKNLLQHFIGKKDEKSPLYHNLLKRSFVSKKREHT